MTWATGLPERAPRVFALGQRTRLALWPEEGIEPTHRLQGVILMDRRRGTEPAAVRIECGADTLPVLEGIATAELSREPRFLRSPILSVLWACAWLIGGALGGAGFMALHQEDAPVQSAAVVMGVPQERGEHQLRRPNLAETGISYEVALTPVMEVDAPRESEAPISVSCIPPDPAPTLIPAYEPAGQHSAPVAEPVPSDSGHEPQAASRSAPVALPLGDPEPAGETNPDNHSLPATGAGDPSLPAEEWLRLRRAEESQRAAGASPVQQ